MRFLVNNKHVDDAKKKGLWEEKIMPVHLNHLVL